MPCGSILYDFVGYIRELPASVGRQAPKDMFKFIKKIFHKMTYKEFEKERVEKLLHGTYMRAVFDTVMKTRQTIDFHDYFDFSYNKNICFSSDYGGENDQSKYYAYTFTFHSYSSLDAWRAELDKLRHEKGYVKPAEYKKIDPDTRKGKLEDWLKTSETNFKGIIVSFAVDKQIDSLFAPSINDFHNAVSAESHYSDCNLSPKILEKAFRISHFSNLVLSQILCDKYGYWWMTDKDSIAQGEDRWKFTVKIHDNTLRHYCEHLTDVTKGYSTPFKRGAEPDYFSEDFLSLSDLISGSIDDFTNHKNGKTPEELLSVLKPKSLEILTYLKKLPTFIYVLDKDEKGVNCKRVLIDVVE